MRTGGKDGSPERGPVGLSRRQALKTGAFVAGAAWVAPVVQSIPLVSASAEAASVTHLRPSPSPSGPDVVSSDVEGGGSPDSGRSLEIPSPEVERSRAFTSGSSQPVGGQSQESPGSGGSAGAPGARRAEDVAAQSQETTGSGGSGGSQGARNANGDAGSTGAAAGSPESRPAVGTPSSRVTYVG